VSSRLVWIGGMATSRLARTWLACANAEFMADEAWAEAEDRADESMEQE
jgi:hypothetical protein